MSHRSAALALPALICLCALAAPPSARADASPADAAAPAATEPAFRPLVGLRATIGQGEGSKTTVTLPDGGVASVDLAGGLEVYAGARFPVAPNGLAVQLTVGVHQSASSNGLSARRIPIEALLLYPVSPTLRVGGGVRYPAHLRLNGAGNAEATGLSATPSIVGVAEVRLTDHVALDFRYVKEQYERASDGTRLDASHFDAGVSAIY